MKKRTVAVAAGLTTILASAVLTGFYMHSRSSNQPVFCDRASLTPAAHSVLQADAWKQFASFISTPTIGGSDKEWGSWSEWNTKACVFAEETCSTASKQLGLDNLVGAGLEIPVQRQLFDQTLLNLKKNGQKTNLQVLCNLPNPSPCAAVLYNRIASKHLKGKPPLNKEGTLKTLAESAAASGNGTDIPPFDDGSIIIKTYWTYVNGQSPAPAVISGHVDSNEGLPLRAFAIDFAKSATCDRRPYRPGTNSGDPVPLGCFFSIRVITPCPHTDPSAGAQVGCPQPGDLYILLGLNLMRKVNHQWYFSTFWWQNEVVSDSARPKNQDKRWVHYRANATNSIKEHQNDPPNKRYVCFNPYIESNQNLAYFASSNCLQCHWLAAYPTSDASAAQNLGAPAPNTAQVLPEGYFKGKVRTDYLWTLPDQFDP